MCHRSISLFLFLTTSLFCFSQEPIELDSVLISASQLSLQTYKTGKSIEVIDGDDLSKYPVNTLDELLRYVGGMNINSRGAFGVQSDIGMRGSTFSQVIVLVDGVRINDPLTGHFNNNFPVAMADIARVEVIKGPAAVSYGSDAVGGLIHIKTKTNLESSPSLKSGGTLDRAYGAYNLVSSDLGGQIIGNKNRFTFSYRQNKADGEEIENPNFPGISSAPATYNNHFNLNTISLSSAHQLNSKLSLQTRLSYDFRAFGAKFFYTRSAFDESVEETTNLWSQATLQRKGENNTVKLDLSYKNSTDLFTFNPLFAANEHEMEQVYVNLNQTINLGGKSKLLYGAQLLNKGIESTDRGDHSNLNVGAYAIYSTELVDNLYANLSLRAENDENFGTEVLPQASLSYRVNDLVLRSSFGKSIRAADFTERYVSFNIPNLTPMRNAGNPDLLAEESNSFDLGVDYDTRNFGFSATGFIRNSENLIDFSLVNELDITNLTNLQDSADYFYASNISESNVYGFELSMYEIGDLTSKLKLKTEFGYTYLKTEGETNELSKYISNHPEHNVSFGVLLFGDARFSLGINGNYVVRQEEVVEESPFEIPASYFIANGVLSYRAADNLNLYAKVYNLTDTQYQEILGAKMPGAWWSVGLRLTR